ncbi:hypothetical protein DFH09DRAFT_1317816 [Mycena vulgaris]|nr:hypothetical protein DFH09DRAFT_1317816 [Mycena vulgaris]
MGLGLVYKCTGDQGAGLQIGRGVVEEINDVVHQFLRHPNVVRLKETRLRTRSALVRHPLPKAPLVPSGPLQSPAPRAPPQKRTPAGPPPVKAPAKGAAPPASKPTTPAPPHPLTPLPLLPPPPPPSPRRPSRHASEHAPFNPAAAAKRTAPFPALCGGCVAQFGDPDPANNVAAGTTGNTGAIGSGMGSIGRAGGFGGSSGGFGGSAGGPRAKVLSSLSFVVEETCDGVGRDEEAMVLQDRGLLRSEGSGDGEGGALDLGIVPRVEGKRALRLGGCIGWPNTAGAGAGGSGCAPLNGNVCAPS